MTSTAELDVEVAASQEVDSPSSQAEVVAGSAGTVVVIETVVVVVIVSNTTLAEAQSVADAERVAGS